MEEPKEQVCRNVPEETTNSSNDSVSMNGTDNGKWDWNALYIPLRSENYELNPSYVEVSTSFNKSANSNCSSNSNSNNNSSNLNLTPNRANGVKRKRENVTKHTIEV